jgi:hypothetical protein
MACTGWRGKKVGYNNGDNSKEGEMLSVLESLPEASGACHRCAEKEELARNLIALATAMKWEEDAERVD